MRNDDDVTSVLAHATTPSGAHAEAREQHIESLRELWLTESDLTFLRELDPEPLGRIVAEVARSHKRVSHSQRALYETMARATRFIPNFMLVKLSSNLSPYVQARICECLEPKAAAALSRAYEPAQLAEIALHLDAKLAASIAALTDIDALVAITNVLSQRGLQRRLGEISDALEPPLLEKLVHRIRDPERIAAVAAHMVALDKLAHVVRRLDDKLRRAVLSALERHGKQHVVAAITAP